MRPCVALEANRAAIRRIVEAHRASNPRVFDSVLHGSQLPRPEGAELVRCKQAGLTRGHKE